MVVDTGDAAEGEVKGDQENAEKDQPPPPPKEKPVRKRKWGSSQSKSTASKSRTSSLEISTDSLKVTTLCCAITVPSVSYSCTVRMLANLFFTQEMHLSWKISDQFEFFF